MTQPAANLRELPSVAELLNHPQVEALTAACGRDWVRSAIRLSLDELREGLAGGKLVGDRSQLTDRALDLLQARADVRRAHRLGRVINATGVVLHTGLGRAALSPAARKAVDEVAAGCNLEVDLVSEERRYRGYQLQSAFQQLTGAGDALIVNNNAAATVLALAGLCRGREVVLSRGQLVEIGGSFRLPEIFVESGARLREVGTTNRTHLGDYDAACGPETAALMRVHPSNYRIIGFTETPDTRALAELAHARGLICIDDLGSGCLVDTTEFHLPAEPTFQDSLAAGADLVLGSGDKLLGGPQCGILLGRADLIATLRNHPLARAFRIDKLRLAALSATLDAYLRGEEVRTLPTLALLGTSESELQRRAQQIVEHLSRALSGHGTSAAGETSPTRSGWQVELRPDRAAVGGGSLPGVNLPTVVIRLQHDQHPPDEISRRLRLGDPRVFARVQQDAVLLDLRSVLPDDDADLGRALERLVGQWP